MIIVRRVVAGRRPPGRVGLRRVVRWRFMRGLFEEGGKWGLKGIKKGGSRSKGRGDVRNWERKGKTNLGFFLCFFRKLDDRLEEK